MPNRDTKSKNDSGPTPRDQNTEIRSSYTHQEYQPEDFSQSAINRGQRRINYELTSACQKLSAALGLLIEVVGKSSTGSEGELAEVKKLVAEATVISNDVASIKPPGCDPGAAKEEEDPGPSPSPQ